MPNKFSSPFVLNGVVYYYSILYQTERMFICFNEIQLRQYLYQIDNCLGSLILGRK